jgi:glycosyltransferase involved in cell wall biosynthesis
VKVLYVDHCARRSGGELALARLLPELDVEAVVVLGEPGPMEEGFAAAGAVVEVQAIDPALAEVRKDSVRFGAGLVARLRMTVSAVWRLRATICEEQPDLVHTNSLKAAVYGGIAGRLARVPVVWHLRDHITTESFPRPAVAAVRMLSRVVPTAVVGNSRSTLATVPGGRIRRVVPSPAATGAHAEQLARGERLFTVVMVGRLAPWKGQDVFLAAFAEAFPDGDERAVVAGEALFGEDAFAQQLEEEVQRIGFADRVELAGFVEDVPALLGRCDVLVHASVISEPFGQVVVEGMAAGLAVVATDQGGPAEIITADVDGILYPPGDASGLARELAALAADPTRVRRLGAAARDAAQQYSPEATAQLMMQVYAAVAR